MSFSPNFSTSQSLANISVLTIQDTSVGTDNTLTGRLVYLKKYDGTYLVPTGVTTPYIFWGIGQSSIDIDCLDKDYCLDITVVWYSGSSASYTKTILTLFRAYSELFLRQLTQAEAANRDLLSDSNFWYNKCKLRTLVDDAIQATAEINDQTIASACLQGAKNLTDNPSMFF